MGMHDDDGFGYYIVMLGTASKIYKQSRVVFVDSKENAESAATQDTNLKVIDVYYCGQTRPEIVR